MKFLDPRFEERNLMPIHIVSYDCFELGARDALSIVFKDIDTGQTYVETIERPKYEVWIRKKELWESTGGYMDCWELQSNMVKVTVSYKYRDQELGKILGVPPEKVKTSPYIFGYDISVEHFYWIQFLLEYGNDLPKPLNIGFFDIESDIIQSGGRFSAPGESPTSAITLIDNTGGAVYTLALGKDNLPILAANNPHYLEYEKIRENFNAQVQAVKDDIPGFIAELHELFDEFYGVLDYQLLIFDDEIQMHTVFWEIVRSLNLDIMEAWNAPYDVRNLIERPLALGYEPESIICDPAFRYKTCFFEEDDNAQVHKRNHRCVISIKPLIICQMWGYAGIGSAGGKPETLKLTGVAKKEIGDEKLNYEEEGNIKTFMYKNWRKFLIYNIKDVLLQKGIEKVTKNTDAIYDRCYDHGMLIPEAFVSTTALTTSMTKYFLENGYVIGTNANRIRAPFNYRQYMADDVEDIRLVASAFGEDSEYNPYEADPDDLVEESFDDPDYDPDFED